MGNPLRGEVSFQTSERTYTLRYGTNELVVLEETLGISMQGLEAFLAEPANVNLKLLRSLFRIGLLGCEPELTDAAAGEIMDSIGLGEATTLILQALTVAFPKGGKAGARPPNREERRRMAATSGSRL